MFPVIRDSFHNSSGTAHKSCVVVENQSDTIIVTYHSERFLIDLIDEDVICETHHKILKWKIIIAFDLFIFVSRNIAVGI